MPPVQTKSLPAKGRWYNARQADKVLAADYSMNLLLPCRISACEMGGRTIIAEKAETTMVTIIEVTAAGE